MKRAAIIAAAAVLSLVFIPLCNSAEQESGKKLESNRKLETIAKLTATIIGQRHYSQQPLDDKVSEKLFDEYLKALDPAKVFFTRKDVAKFARYRTSLDDQLLIGSLDFAFLVYNRYLERFDEYCVYAKEVLKQGFDFGVDEDFDFDRSKAEWPADDAEMRELWRKRLKNAVLTQMLADKAQDMESARKKDGEKNPLWEKKSPEERLVKKLDQMLQDLRQNEPVEVLSIYLSSLTRIYDPHSAYMSPQQEDSFNIAMKLSLVGIGALLSSEDGYTKIVRIIPGGPAEKDGRLKPEDRIVAVAQEGESPVDIMDMPINKVVQLIRGEEGSTVALTVLPGDKGKGAVPQIIKIVRNKVELQEQAASGKTEVIKDAAGKDFRLGIITLPSFYMDFNEAAKGGNDYKSSTSDVSRLLEKFKQEKIDGLVLDMRSNGGGSLQEAIKLTGLFIERGPVVQIKDSSGRIAVKEDYDPAIQYDGPMVVLVNKLSASATEIFAGAIKDYKRGIVLGDSHTHGKGTVQTVFELADLLSIFGVSFKAGAIKFTNAKFYRINGHSTQLKGVEPHISFPSFTDTMKIGEVDIDYAMPWDAIKAVPYKEYCPTLDDEIKILKGLSDKRLDANPRFKILKNDIDTFARLNQNKIISLNKEKRWNQYLEEKKLRDQQEKLLKLEDKDGKVDNSRKDDLYLNEAMRILVDFIEMNCKKSNCPAASVASVVK